MLILEFELWKFWKINQTLVKKQKELVKKSLKVKLTGFSIQWLKLVITINQFLHLKIAKNMGEWKAKAFQKNLPPISGMPKMASNWQNRFDWYQMQVRSSQRIVKHTILITHHGLCEGGELGGCVLAERGNTVHSVRIFKHRGKFTVLAKKIIFSFFFSYSLLFVESEKQNI
jgi:hypothetical protein